MQADLPIAAMGRLGEFANAPVTFPSALRLSGIGDLVDEVCEQRRIPLLPK
jgi:hypothetical protein